MGNPRFQQDWRKKLAAVQTALLHVGQMLYFPSNRLFDPTNDEPHYYPIVAIDGDTVYFLACQSNMDSVINQIEYKGKLYSTFPCIRPTAENGLKLDSWIDCNHIVDYSLTELTKMAEQGKISFRGVLSYSDYEQLRYGLSQSPTNFLPDEILIYPENLRRV